MTVQFALIISIVTALLIPFMLGRAICAWIKGMGQLLELVRLEILTASGIKHHSRDELVLNMLEGD